MGKISWSARSTCMTCCTPRLSRRGNMLQSRAKLVRLMAFDVDGIMTDGGLYLSDSGEEFKRFNSQDGHGLKMLIASGVEVAIITGRTSRCVAARAQNLGIKHVFQGVENKLETMVW